MAAWLSVAVLCGSRPALATRMLQALLAAAQDEVAVRTLSLNLSLFSHFLAHRTFIFFFYVRAIIELYNLIFIICKLFMYIQ